METMEFNLLREPWVRVRTQDGTIRTVSLTDALLHAHAYVDLAGEMPTQDAAMLRLLLAVLHTVFSRVDATVPTLYSIRSLNFCLRRIRPCFTSTISLGSIRAAACVIQTCASYN